MNARDNAVVAADVAENITAEEFRQRVAAVRTAIAGSDLSGLLAFGDCWRGANVGYFTEFRPLDGVSDIANALFVLGPDGSRRYLRTLPGVEVFFFVPDGPARWAVQRRRGGN